MHTMYYYIYYGSLNTYSQVPAHDGTYLTPATRLLEVQHEMIEVDESLNVRKEVYIVVAFFFFFVILKIFSQIYKIHINNYRNFNNAWWHSSSGEMNCS